MVRINALPTGMQVVPSVPADWKRWRDKALIYRINVRDAIEWDEEVRRLVLDDCAADPLYDMLLFGVVFEPRDRPGRPKGWWPLIPMEFQARLTRWIEEVESIQPGTPAALLGRKDAVLEKARGMAGSYTFCAVAAHHWKYHDGFVAGFMSYKQDLVEKSNTPDALFYKIEAYLGLNARVPDARAMEVAGSTLVVPMRAPGWTIPDGFGKADNNELVLAHPFKTNVLNGYSTGERTGVGARSTWMVLDEAAKFPQFGVVWNSIAETTDHRFALSSADVRFGTDFRDLARYADQAVQSGMAGPAFLRLRPEEHPERDDVWREEAEARHAGSEAAKDSLKREYDLDYDAGSGLYIYSAAKQIKPKALTFHPGDEQIDFTIDPGIDDLTAFHLVKYDPGVHRYGVLASYVNSGLPAEFYATLVCDSPLQDYTYEEPEEEIMAWFRKYRTHIRFWVGDPAGKQRGGGRATSFYDDFRKATAKLLDRERGVVIWSSDKPEYKHFPGRISALRELLKICDFNDTPDVRRTLAAIADYHRKAQREGQETTTENTIPVHGAGSDRVTALEYYAAHRKMGITPARQALDVVEPERYTISGKAWSKARVAPKWAVS